MGENFKLLQAQVKANRDLEASLIQMIHGYAAKLDMAKENPNAVAELLAEMKEGALAMSACVVANTNLIVDLGQVPPAPAPVAQVDPDVVAAKVAEKLKASTVSDEAKNTPPDPAALADVPVAVTVETHVLDVPKVVHEVEASATLSAQASVAPPAPTTAPSVEPPATTDAPVAPPPVVEEKKNTDTEGLPPVPPASDPPST